MTIYAYTGTETIGKFAIKEITVKEDLKKNIEKFDETISKINKKMINDLIHSHVNEKQNKTLLSVMINEEDIKRESKTAKKLVKMLFRSLEEKMFKKGTFAQNGLDTEDYKKKYEGMISKLSKMLELQKSVQQKMRETSKVIETLDKLDLLVRDIEYIEGFAKNLEAVSSIKQIQDIIVQLSTLERNLGPQFFDEVERKIGESVERTISRARPSSSGSDLWLYIVISAIVGGLGFWANMRLKKAEKSHNW